MNKRHGTARLGTTAAALCAVALVGATPALAHQQEGNRGQDKTVTLNADLTQLNGSGAYGTATVVVRNQKILSTEVHAHGLTPDAPHAQHIHYGDDARNECPGLFDDADGDGRITTVEGVPAYGPVVLSLTTTGDTSPASVLAVDRFPVAEDGSYHYQRGDMNFTPVAGTGYTGGEGTPKQIADAIRAGEGVVVIHGVDYDGDGMYSFSDEGASELDPSLPAEATDPAVCGILR
ncbi:hypothetical protein N866_01310 [Actinotalea ferrariae CF5-4]|uniref:CHRD domain-containing protein n=1 Tax=Actinotalea ferrariae CF5-4 TaxID=948458 RepID=A0A021VQA9_9CELL|nr:hypothetical protein [Actinotalea ferrariae]EYR63336.1 hypothetical protein N866_01310 [Actinotalea ferrariae CF5-4]